MILNADRSVRGRGVTTYRGHKPLMALAYKGMADPWFIEHYPWPEDGGGFLVEMRSFDGDRLVIEIFPPNDDDTVKTLDGNGKELSDERCKALSDEIGDILF